MSIIYKFKITCFRLRWHTVLSSTCSIITIRAISEPSDIVRSITVSATDLSLIIFYLHLPNSSQRVQSFRQSVATWIFKESRFEPPQKWDTSKFNLPLFRTNKFSVLMKQRDIDATIATAALEESNESPAVTKSSRNSYFTKPSVEQSQKFNAAETTVEKNGVLEINACASTRLAHRSQRSRGFLRWN